MNRTLFVVATLTFVATGCADRAGPAPRHFTFDVVQTYGSEDLGPDSLELPERTRRAGGGVLGQIRGFVQAEDSTLWVLDRAWYKIAAFRPDGSLRDVIVAGRGKGPGELQLPVSIGLMPDGRLAVLDYEQRRINFYDPEAGFTSTATVELGNPMRLYPKGDEIWVTRILSPGSKGAQAIAFDETGRRVREAAALPESEQAFGGRVSLATTRDGELVIPSSHPGLWRILATEDTDPIGEDLFPGLAPPIITPEENSTAIGMPEANTQGFTQFRDGVTLFWYWTIAIDERGWPARGSTPEIRIAAFDASGARIGEAAFPAGVIPTTAAPYWSPVTDHVFIQVAEPYPAVVEMALREDG